MTVLPQTASAPVGDRKAAPIPPYLRLPLLMTLLVALLAAVWRLWLVPAVAVEADRVASLASQRDQVAADIAAANQDLSVLARTAAAYRRLEQQGVFRPQDRLALTEALDARIADLGLREASYRFLPVEEARVDPGGAPLLRRTVPIEIAAAGIDDFALLELARMAALPQEGLLRVERLVLRRQEAGPADWLAVALTGAHPDAAVAELRLSWVTLAPPGAVP